MRSLIVVTVLFLVSGFGLVLVLGLFGVVDLQYLYVDLVGVTQGVRYKSYTSNRNGLQVKYPSDWVIDEQLLESRVNFEKVQEDQAIAGFILIAEETEEGFDFEQYTQTEIDELSGRTGYEREDLRETTVAGFPALQLTFKLPSSNDTLSVRRSWFVNEGKIYRLSRQVNLDKVEDSDAMWGVLDQMLSSFRVLDLPGL